MKTFNIFIENTYEDFGIDEVKLLNNLRTITGFLLEQKEVFENSCLSKYKFDTLCFDVVLCNNQKIQEINRDYRSQDKSTDVISFAIFADSPEDERFVFDDEINLGEIIISLDKIKEQAEENNNSFEQELYYLLAHGVLHCLGFDHENQKDYDFMVEHQEKAKVVLNV